MWKFDDEHILERIEKRTQSCNPRTELDRIKQVLQTQVPEDWRLTRFSTDFLIKDLKAGITLVGSQARMNGSTTILKRIKSALPKGALSRGKLGKHAGSADAFEIAKRPNLFLGDVTIHPIFSSSPVLARQYEKVFYETKRKVFTVEGENFVRFANIKSPLEFLRLHPLTPSGIEHTQFIWMKWLAQNGTSKFIKTNPPKEFHGEDFWILEVYNQY